MFFAVGPSFEGAYYIMTANALQKPVEKRGGGTENRRLPKSKKSLTIITPNAFDFFQPLELQNLKKVPIKSFNKFIITMFSQY